MQWFIQEQRKCKLCHSALVAFYTLFAFRGSPRSRQVLSMEGDRGRLQPAATAGRAPVQTGSQRWVTAQGKASDQRRRFMTEGIWGTDTKVKSSPSPIAPICTVQCTICSVPPNREEATPLLGLCLHQHSSSLAWEGSKYSECDTAQSGRKLGDFSWKETWGTLLKDGHLTRKDTLISNCSLAGKLTIKPGHPTRCSWIITVYPPC